MDREYRQKMAILFLETGLLQNGRNLQIIIDSQSYSPFNRIGSIHL